MLSTTLVQHLVLVCLVTAGRLAAGGQANHPIITDERAHLAAHPLGRTPFGTPITDWYFVLQTTSGWFSRKPPYCGLSSDPSQPYIVLTCDKDSPPLFSLFTLVSPTRPPALTGHPLLLVSRTYGLCGVIPEVETDEGVIRTPGIVCQSRFHDGPPAAYSLLGPDLQMDQPIDLSQQDRTYYLLQNGKFCGVADTVIAKSMLVCDLNSTTGAMRFSMMMAALPSASLTSLATPQATCGVKSLILPPPHPLSCSAASSDQLLHSSSQQRQYTNSGTALDQHPYSNTEQGQQQYGSTQQAKELDMPGKQELQSSGDTSSASSSARKRPSQRYRRALAMANAHGTKRSSLRTRDDCMIYNLTFLLQKPGLPLTSGSIAAIVTYSPGLVGLPLQQCCPDPSEPHVLDCGLATGDPLPKDCWFRLLKVAGQPGDLLQDGDIIMLQSKAFGRYCSVSFDGTMLCVSASPSNATRNLFTLSLPLAGSAIGRDKKDSGLVLSQ